MRVSFTASGAQPGPQMRQLPRKRPDAPQEAQRGRGGRHPARQRRPAPHGDGGAHHAGTRV